MDAKGDDNKSRLCGTRLGEHWDWDGVCEIEHGPEVRYPPCAECQRDVKRADREQRAVEYGCSRLLAYISRAGRIPESNELKG